MSFSADCVVSYPIEQHDQSNMLGDQLPTHSLIEDDEEVRMNNQLAYSCLMLCRPCGSFAPSRTPRGLRCCYSSKPFQFRPCSAAQSVSKCLLNKGHPRVKRCSHYPMKHRTPSLCMLGTMSSRTLISASSPCVTNSKSSRLL